MMRSMFSGVSGLRIHQTKMDVIANNIANVNTVGYKSSRVTFTEVFNQTLSGASGANANTGRGGVNPMQIGLGASVSSIDKLMSTGASQRTDAPLDLMISGDAFFIVGDDSGTFFTKAGAFKLDNDGNLAMPNGLKVLGWDVEEVDGEWRAVKGVVKPMTITGDKEYVVPAATTLEAASGNLSSDKMPVKDGTMEFYDTVGNRYTVDVQYTYVPASGTETDGWAFSIGNYAYLNGERTNAFKIEAEACTDFRRINFVEHVGKPDEEVITYTPVAALFFSAGKLLTVGSVEQTGNVYELHSPATADEISKEFNLTILPGPDGSTANVLTPAATFGNNNIVRMNFADITNFGNEQANATITRKNGNAPGQLADISVGPDGSITGRYSNGDTRLLGQIAVARFANPEGLQKVGDNLFVTTANSGDFDGIGEEAQKGEQRILGGVLEMSNVDLASEFTDMITTQRGFQANSRVITTSDDMLQELVNLKR